MLFILTDIELRVNNIKVDIALVQIQRTQGFKACRHFLTCIAVITGHHRGPATFLNGKYLLDITVTKNSITNNINVKNFCSRTFIKV